MCENAWAYGFFDFYSSMIPKEQNSFELTEQEKNTFIDFIWDKYALYSRPHLPWRADYGPYKVLLSELMLQQTQVSRVIVYFDSFVRRWPTISALARAAFREVLEEWGGLGYNRRAKYLHATAKQITTIYDGRVPSNKSDLIQLPGIGDYTASALLAFAFNKKSIVIETNIRKVIIHHFFKGIKTVSDEQIKKVLAQLLEGISDYRTWYWALMDYGSELAKQVKNPSARSSLYKKQSQFDGSLRKIRGRVVEVLRHKNAITKAELYTEVESLIDPEEYTGQFESMFDKSVANLVKEELLCYYGDYISITNSEL